MVKSAKELSGLPTSIKIRIGVDHVDVRRAVDLVHLLEAAGVAWVTVHGRTAKERTRVPVHLDAVAAIKAAARVPIIHNGDIFGPADVSATLAATGADGVMSARGVLANPALFAGYATCPLACAVDYLKLALEYGGHFAIHQHHVCYMLATWLSPPERVVLQHLTSLSGVVDFFRDRGWWTAADDASLAAAASHSHSHRRALPVDTLSLLDLAAQPDGDSTDLAGDDRDLMLAPAWRPPQSVAVATAWRATILNPFADVLAVAGASTRPGWLACD